MAYQDKLASLSNVEDLEAWASKLDSAPSPAQDAPLGRGPVALTGRLRGLNFTSVLQFLGLIKKTGRLTVTNRNSQACILFRDGRIAYAASNSVRETLGNMLVCDGHISEQVLVEALERQHRSRDWVRLGDILAEMGAVERSAIERLLEEQIEKEILEIAAWEDGFFKFELLNLADGPRMAVDAQDFVVEGGLSPDMVICRMADRLDEICAPEAASDGDADPTAAEVPDLEVAPASSLPGGSAAESPTFTAEVTLRVEQQAARVLDRAVLFLCRPGWLTGMGQVGLELDNESPDHAVRQLCIPSREPSVLRAALSSAKTCRGPLEPCRWNQHLIEAMGGEAPVEAVAMPMTVEGSVVMVLYGDNLQTGRPLSELDELESCLKQLGLEIEKRALKRTVQELEAPLICEPNP